MKYWKEKAKKEALQKRLGKMKLSGWDKLSEGTVYRKI